MRAAILVLLLAAAAHAAVLCPRVTSEHNADTSDLARFRQFHKWRGLTGQDLAIAVWKYTCDKQTGLYHMNEVLDGPDPSKEFSTVRDPIKILNVYNVGYCGLFGPTLHGIFYGIGFEQGRSFSVPGWNHKTTEVFYDGAWHYYDLDVRGALVRPDGVVASVEEARRDVNLWLESPKRIQPCFPNDGNLARVHRIYKNSRIDYHYREFQAGHVMDFQLRQGETLTRFWRPRDGRWRHLPGYNKGFVRKLLERAPRGYKSNHRAFSIWTQGNGLWEYQPNLKAPSSDFADGVRSVSGLAPAADGLKLTAAKGEAIFEVFSPWIIVAKINKLDDETDDEEASVVTLDAALPVTLAVSVDHGKTWQDAGSVQSGKGSVDLTKLVKNRYGYLLKLSVAGSMETTVNPTVIRSMKITTWVQVAPVSLPRLKQGVNKCRFDLGDRYDGATLPMIVRPNTADPAELGKWAVQMPAHYTPERISGRIRGDVILKLEAPEGMPIAWFTAGAAFTTHQRGGAKNTANAIAYAVGEPKAFKEIYRAKNMPDWINHWRYQMDKDVRLDTPAKVVYVKYTGKPAVNALRTTLHLKPKSKLQQAVEITHGIKVNGKLVEKKVNMQASGDYTVEVDGECENVFVRLANPSK